MIRKKTIYKNTIQLHNCAYDGLTKEHILRVVRKIFHIRENTRLKETVALGKLHILISILE
jgi:hypothetical protein